MFPEAAFTAAKMYKEPKRPPVDAGKQVRYEPTTQYCSTIKGTAYGHMLRRGWIAKTLRWVKMSHTRSDTYGVFSFMWNGQNRDRKQPGSGEGQRVARAGSNHWTGTELLLETIQVPGNSAARCLHSTGYSTPLRCSHYDVRVELHLTHGPI